MRVQYTGLLLLTFCPALHAQLSEIEPNESIAEATPWAYGQTMSGSECNPVIGTDYFLIVLPTDGVINFTITSQGTGLDPADLQFALFPKYGFYQQYHTLPATTSPTTQSFSHGCLSGDTMYVRVQAGEVMGLNSCTSYTMEFTVTPAAFMNDPIPNDDFADPQPVALATPIEGHLSFLYDNSADHYGLDLPDDGTLRVIAEAEQHDTVAGSTIEVYVNTLNEYGYPVIGAASVPVLDTFYFDCIRAGSTTIRVQPGAGTSCGISYRLRFDLLPPVYGNDPEPNDDNATATVVPPDTDQDGHITYSGTSGYDNFKLWKGFAGTMRVVFSSHTEGPSPALNIWTLNANVNENITTGENGEVAADTVYVTTTGPDTIIMRVSGLSFDYCGSYRFRYESGPVGMEGLATSADAIQVWPDPSEDGRFNLRIPVATITRLVIIDASGRTCLDERPMMVNGMVTVDASSLVPGIYTARVLDAAGRWTGVRLVRAK